MAGQKDLTGLGAPVKVQRVLEEPRKDHWKRAWAVDEHDRFLDGLRTFGRGKWKEVAEVVGTRTASQVQSHAQKYFLKQEKKVTRRASEDDAQEERGEDEAEGLGRRQRSKPKDTAETTEYHQDALTNAVVENDVEREKSEEAGQSPHEQSQTQLDPSHEQMSQLLPIMFPWNAYNAVGPGMGPLQLLSAALANGAPGAVSHPLLGLGGMTGSRPATGDPGAAGVDPSGVHSQPMMSPPLVGFGQGLVPIPPPTKLRITVHRNGDLTHGKAMIVPDTLESMLAHAAKKLGLPHCAKVYTRSGGEIESLDEILNDDCLYFSTGEPFIDPEDEDEDIDDDEVYVDEEGLEDEELVEDTKSIDHEEGIDQESHPRESDDGEHMGD